eukprot:1158851-Pelagomonas_calceolata.AAC.8
MLNCLDFHARRKHLVINTAKSEVVYFYSSGSNLPVFSVGGVPLAHKESYKYLGMWFHTHISMAKPPSILQALSSSMCTSQVWGTEYAKEGKELSSDLECGHGMPLQFYCFKSAVKMYNGLLNANCETLRKVMKVGLHLHSRAPSCWTAQILDGFQGLGRLVEGTHGSSEPTCLLFLTFLRQQLGVQAASDFPLQHNIKLFLWGGEKDALYRLESLGGSLLNARGRTASADFSFLFFLVPFKVMKSFHYCAFGSAVGWRGSASG